MRWNWYQQQGRYPCIVIANPDMKGFNEYDICKKLMKDQNIPVLLLLDPDSTHKAQIDQCRADEELTRLLKSITGSTLCKSTLLCLINRGFIP